MENMQETIKQQVREKIKGIEYHGGGVGGGDWATEEIMKLLFLAVKQEREKFDTILAEKVERIEKEKRIRKPTHGSCCTCQTCGGSNDDTCDCPRNHVLDEVITILKG